MNARLAQWMVFWLALTRCSDLSAHVTTTGLVRIELSGDRLSYALSIALPDIPPNSASILSAAANGDRLAAEKIAEAARESVKIQLAGISCRAGRVRIGGAGTNETRATIEIDFACDAQHGRLTVSEDWGGLLGQHHQNLANIRTSNGERQVVFD